MIQRNLCSERGVTLMELLVVIAIMGIVLIPVTMLMYTTLYTQTEITERNQLQQEAQLIMEQITSAMQDGAIWCQEGTALVLKAPMLAEGKDDTPGDCTGEDLIRYERAKQTLHYVKDSANILLSSNIQDLVLDPEPSNHELTEQAVRLVLEKNKQTYEVKTKITYQRF